MSSSFKHRLERLHRSRKRARERQQDEQHAGVFHSEDAREMQTPPGKAPLEEASPPPCQSDREHGNREAPDAEGKADEPPGMTVRRAEPADEASRGASHEPADGDEHRKTEVGEQLARRYSLRERSRRTRPESHRPDDEHTPSSSGDSRTEDVSRETSSGGADDPRPNERAAVLRRRVESLLAEDAWEQALPILYEIVALQPRHAFALETLVDYHRRQGNERLADQFASRLRDVAPF